MRLQHADTLVLLGALIATTWSCAKATDGLSGGGSDDDDSSEQGAGGSTVSGIVGSGGSTSNTGAGAAGAQGGSGAQGGVGATTATTTTGSTSAGPGVTSASSSSSSSSSTTSSSSTGGGAMVCAMPTNVLTDGDLEQGPAAGTWVESSTNFGTPICTMASCGGNGGGTGPVGGDYWAWFGGLDTAPETAVLEQTVTIPSGTAFVQFQLEVPICDSPADTFTVAVDGSTVFTVTGADPSCGAIGYQTVTIDISAYADGASHSLELRGDTYAFFFGATNFFTDDIQVLSCP